MRFYAGRDEKVPVSQALVDLGRDLLLRYDFDDAQGMRDHNVAGVVKETCAGAAGQDTARAVCLSLRDRVDDYSLSYGDVHDVVRTLFKLHPEIALDSFLLGSRPVARSLFVSGFTRFPPIESLSAETIRAWADQDPAVRYPRVGEVMSLFRREEYEEGNDLSPLFVDLLSTAPDKAAFLGEPRRRLHPRSYGGSLADVLKVRKESFETLLDDPDVAAWYANVRPILEGWISNQRREDGEAEESFE
ncbi:MAG: hypothetical protein EON96_01280 [Caulobacteraceae bacterium]|nr:MAG: hypothetical protein EON96_01280 [Caulobacteraceae bacterium]